MLTDGRRDGDGVALPSVRARALNVPGWRLFLVSHAVAAVSDWCCRQKLHTYTSCFRAYRTQRMSKDLEIQEGGFLGVAEMVCAAGFCRSRSAWSNARPSSRSRMLGRSKMKLFERDRRAPASCSCADRPAARLAGAGARRPGLPEPNRETRNESSGPRTKPETSADSRSPPIRTPRGQHTGRRGVREQPEAGDRERHAHEHEGEVHEGARASASPGSPRRGIRPMGVLVGEPLPIHTADSGHRPRARRRDHHLRRSRTWAV